MDASRKSFEIQAHVRHNAEAFRNILSDLYSWEKEMKDTEAKLKSQVELQPSQPQHQLTGAHEPFEADEAPLMQPSMDIQVSQSMKFNASFIQ